MSYTKLNAIHARGTKRACPRRKPSKGTSRQQLKSKNHPSALNHSRGWNQGYAETKIFFPPQIPCATPPAVILTHVPLAPALARHQMAHWEAVITTNISMLALARHQTATISLFVAMTNSPCNAWQNAIELRAIASMGHLCMEDLRAAMITPRSGPPT